MSIREGITEIFDTKKMTFFCQHGNNYEKIVDAVPDKDFPAITDQILTYLKAEIEKMGELNSGFTVERLMLEGYAKAIQDFKKLLEE